MQANNTAYPLMNTNSFFSNTLCEWARLKRRATGHRRNPGYCQTDRWLVKKASSTGKMAPEQAVDTIKRSDCSIANRMTFLNTISPMAIVLLFLLSSAPHLLALAPVDLRCALRVNPLGIGDVNPRLSWQLQSTPSLRGETQSAYQIQVGSTAGAMDLWDSGKVAGSQTVDVLYGGQASTSGEKCYWQVRVYDGSNNVSRRLLADTGAGGKQCTVQHHRIELDQLFGADTARGCLFISFAKTNNPADRTNHHQRGDSPVCGQFVQRLCEWAVDDEFDHEPQSSRGYGGAVGGDSVDQCDSVAADGNQRGGA